MMVNKNAPCPRQYVWVYEFNDDAVLRPDWAAEPSSMSLKHLGFLSFLKISAISNPHFPAPLYLRWELVPTAKEALLLWGILELPKVVQELFRKNKTALQRRLHPVFVEAHNGLHHGR